MSKDTVNRQVNVFIETGNAQKALDTLTAKEKTLKEALAQATDPAVIKKLNDEITKLAEPIDRATKKLKGELSPSLKEMQTTVAKLNTELSKMSKEDPGYAKKLQQYNQATLQYQTHLSTIKNINIEHNSLFGKAGELIKEYGAEALALGGIAAGFEAIKGAIEAAIEKEENIARFKSTLDNIGRSDAFDRLTLSATKFAQRFSYLQEDDILPVFEQLITYGKLTEAQINDLTPVIINFAAKQRVSLTEATSAIIKALEGQGRELKQYGLNIKDAGTETERLNVIMTTLKAKVDGAADAFGQTTAGNIAATKKEFKETAETVGDELLPVLNKLLQAIQFITIGTKDLFSRLSDGIKSIYNLAFDQNQFVLDQVAKEQQERQDAILSDTDNFITAFRNRLNLLTGKDVDKQQADLISKAIEEKNKELDNAYRVLASERAQNSKEGIEYEKKRIDTINAEISALSSLNKTLGVSAEEAPKKAKELQDYAKAFQDILNRINEFNSKALSINVTPLEKELREAFDQYDRLFISIRDLRDADEKDIANKLKAGDINAQQAAEQRKVVEEKSRQDLLALETAYQNNKAAIVKKFADEQIKKQKEETDKLFQEELKSIQRITQELQKNSEQFFSDQVAAARIDQLNNDTIENKKKLLQAEQQQEIAAVTALHNKKEISEIEFQKRIAEIKKKYVDLNGKIDLEALEAFKKKTLEVISDAQQVFTALEEYNNFQNSQDEARLDQEQANADARKKILDNELAGKKISQQQYDREIAANDKRLADERRKIKVAEFRREQQIAIVKAVIDTASAVVEALPNYVLAGLVGATGALEIGLISAQKPPTYGKGGTLLSGPSHQSRSKGMPVVNPETGRTVALVEGGEAVLSKETYRNNKRLVDQLLDSSMHRNGATVRPMWKSSSPINFGHIQSSYNRVKMFDKGGFIPAADNVQQAQPATVPAYFNDEQFNALLTALNQPFRGYIVYKDITDAAARLSDIENESKFR